MANAQMLVPWIFDYYTKLDFSPAHKIHKIHALRMVSASSALSSCFCYRGLAKLLRRSKNRESRAAEARAG